MAVTVLGILQLPSEPTNLDWISLENSAKNGLNKAFSR
jgi:hypothetical protein